MWIRLIHRRSWIDDPPDAVLQVEASILAIYRVVIAIVKGIVEKVPAH